MDVERRLTKVEDDKAKKELCHFLEAFTAPAFGSLPKREIELAVFELLRNLGLIRPNASLYELMTELRITRAKASQLLFDLEVRRVGGSPDTLDKLIQDALVATKFAKDGDYFVLEIENPLVLAHLRDRIRRIGHISDTSFNTAIVRMPLDAATDLMIDMIPEDRRTNVRDALEAAGAPKKTTLKNVLMSSLKKLGSRVLGEAADGLVDNAGEFLKPILAGAVETIDDKWSQVWKPVEENKQ